MYGCRVEGFHSHSGDLKVKRQTADTERVHHHAEDRRPHWQCKQTAARPQPQPQPHATPPPPSEVPRLQGQRWNTAPCSHCVAPIRHVFFSFSLPRSPSFLSEGKGEGREVEKEREKEGEKEGRREGRKEGRREGRREGGREVERGGGKERWRDGGREGEREGGRVGEREVETEREEGGRCSRRERRREGRRRERRRREEGKGGRASVAQGPQRAE